MKNKKLLYGILGIGALTGLYFLYKKYTESINVSLQKSEASKGVLVEVRKNKKLIYSRFIGQRNLKEGELFNSEIYSTKDFTLREFQQNQPHEHWIGVELYNSKGKQLERVYEIIKK